MEREKAKSFRELIVWQKAHALVLDIYRETKSFPKEELFGIVSQMRRSSVSVAANIAEGFKKKGKADKLKFFNTSQGSLSETEYFIMLSTDLKYSAMIGLMEKAIEVGRILESYMNSIDNSR
jgi:four helix bundle protein